MNKLRKILSLVIITVMALCMIQLASASGFTDSDRIKYTEAVDVLTGIGVIEGFPDGTFAPLVSVTRAQAATILARLLLGRSIADALPDGPTGFSDVDGVSGVGFAVNYISYCVSRNIIVGFPDGTFRPNNPVTAAQFAVMLMRALNIGDSERFVGPEWETYAILYGTDNHLLDTNVGYSLAANREQTAKYAFNGLLFSPGGQTDIVAKDSLAAKVYPTLKKGAAGLDAFGNPGIVWTYGTSAEVIHSNAVSGGAVQIALVIGFDSKTVQSSGQSTTTYTARIVDTSGVASSVPISAELFNESGRDVKYRGVVCSYTVTPSGQYAFTAPAVSAPGDYLLDSDITGISNRGKVLSGGSIVDQTNEMTRFVVVSYSRSGNSFGPDGTVSIFGGSNAVPTLSLLSRTTAVSLKSGSSGPDGIADIVYIYDDVFSPARESYVFILGTWSRSLDGYIVDVIARGMLTGIQVKDETERDKLISLEGFLLKGVSVTSGVVTPGEVWNANWDAAKSIKNNAGFLILDENLSGITVDDDIPVYTINIPASGPKDATVTATTAYDLYTAVSLDAGDFAYIAKYNGVVTSIFIITGIVI